MFKFIKKQIDIRQTFLNSIYTAIRNSCISSNKTSSTRIISYIITVLVILIVCTIITGTIFIIYKTKSIPNEILIVLCVLLTHQLTLLGINKYHETKQKKDIDHNSFIDNKKINDNNILKS